MKTLFLFLFIFVIFSCEAQLNNKYYNDIKKADSFYKAKQYRESSLTYLKTFAANASDVWAIDRYNAARAMAMAGMVDSAFIQLKRIDTIGGYDDYNTFSNDSAFLSLYTDKRWEKLCIIVKKNRETADAKLNKPLIARLDTILNDDQEDRLKLASVTKKYGIKSDEYQQLWARQDKKDSMNVLKVTRILDEYGWLGSDVIGNEGNTTLFLVIQHADIQIQKKYLPIMREAVKKHNADNAAFAMLEDRVALREGRKQIYGSQVATGADGTMYVEPLEDPDNVDKRRQEVGLGPIAGYLQNWDIKWDVEAYKKQLPRLEIK